MRSNRCAREALGRRRERLTLRTAITPRALSGPEPAAYAVVSAARLLRLGTALEEGNDLIGAQHDRKLTRLPRVGIRSGIIASPSVTP